MKRYNKIQMNHYAILFLIFLMALFHDECSLAGEVEDKFIKAGLVSIHSIDESIKVDLVNSSPDKNFFRENCYGDLSKAYLVKEVAIKLSQAQLNLKNIYPSFSIQILDAARPLSVSKFMYNKMKGTKFEKYVANPESGSMHNYGVAVDITIVDENINEIDMGFTPFRKNNIELLMQFVKMKIGLSLSDEQKKNRELLADIMKQAGFFPLSFEWWHFEGIDKNVARQKYKIIE